MLSSLNHRRSLILQALFSAVLVSLLPLPAASELANATRSRELLTSCNLFHGKWVPDPSYPLYQSSGCPFIDPEFDCIKYGRPDKQFLKFSWKPDSCNLPRFNGVDFLKRWSGKKIMFVGDSLSLNQWQSLACMLHAASPNSKYNYIRQGTLSHQQRG